MISGPISDCPALEPVMNELLEVSGYLWQRGWAERNAGNISIDVTELVAELKAELPDGKKGRFGHAYPLLANRSFLVTGSGRRFRDVAKAPSNNVCILRIGEKGRAYELVWGGESGPDFRPTSEFPTHLRLHEFLRETNAPERTVLHTHPTDLIALTHMPEYRGETELNRVLWCVHPEVKVNLPRGVGFVPYEIPGSETLAQATVTGFRRGHPVVLWEMHGCVAKAAGPMVAFDLIDIANKAAIIVLKCRAAGHAPAGLSERQLEDLVRTFGLEG